MKGVIIKNMIKKIKDWGKLPKMRPKFGFYYLVGVYIFFTWFFFYLLSVEVTWVNLVGVFLNIIVIGFTFISIIFGLAFLVDIFSSIVKFPVKWLKKLPYLKAIQIFKNKVLNKYDLPIILYITSFWPISILMMGVVNLFPEINYLGIDEYTWGYLFATISYLIVMYVGMYLQSIKISKKCYLDRLKHHKEFVNLASLPATFLIGIVSLLSFFSDIEISTSILTSIIDFFGAIRLAPINLLTMGVKIIGFTVLLSLLTVLLGYFVNLIFMYFWYNGKFYKRFINKVIRLFFKFNE